MFINLTNHPVSKWSKEQVEAAEQLAGPAICLTSHMPIVPPEDSGYEVRTLAMFVLHTVKQTLDTMDSCNTYCLVQGEYTMTYALVNLLQQEGYVCVTATTNRDVVETIQEDGSVKKESVFRFVRFREYAVY